ncbi:TerD family protein [Sinomonas sp. P47F7]|uniref:TerD family protein n=1 Tax=Sinomonas sp. P47F7 TaxID=3410987 RepID=UPI003BF4F383
MSAFPEGGTLALTAGDPGLAGVMVGMGWTVEPGAGPLAEPVALAIVCGEDGRALTREHLVFFNQLTTASPGIAFSLAEGTLRSDAEQIDVDFGAVPEDVTRIAFVTYVDPEVRGPGTFGTVHDAYIRVTRPDGTELVRFDAPPAKPGTAKAVLFGELFRDAGGWAFRALGRGYENGLAGVGAEFGLDV